MPPYDIAAAAFVLAESASRVWGLNVGLVELLHRFKRLNHPLHVRIAGKPPLVVLDQRFEQLDLDLGGFRGRTSPSWRTDSKGWRTWHAKLPLARAVILVVQPADLSVFGSKVGGVAGRDGPRHFLAVALFRDIHLDVATGRSIHHDSSLALVDRDLAPAVEIADARLAEAATIWPKAATSEERLREHRWRRHPRRDDARRLRRIQNVASPLGRAGVVALGQAKECFAGGQLQILFTG